MILEVEVLDEEDGLEETLLKDELEVVAPTSHPLMVPINAKSTKLFFNNTFIKCFFLIFTIININETTLNKTKKRFIPNPLENNLVAGGGFEPSTDRV